MDGSKNALILSGGGARAAYQVGVLKALAEILPEGACNPFPIICGTSAGAINAVTLAAHEGCFAEAVTELEQTWTNLDPGQVYKYGWWELTKGLGRFGFSLFNEGIGIKRTIALLDNAPLRLLIRRTVHFEKIDRAIARGDLEAVSVTAMGYTSGKSVCFFQGKPEMEGWERHRRIGRRTLLGADHLMASSAIPTLFPTTRIEHEFTATAHCDSSPQSAPPCTWVPTGYLSSASAATAIPTCSGTSGPPSTPLPWRRLSATCSTAPSSTAWRGISNPGADQSADLLDTR